MRQFLSTLGHYGRIGLSYLPASHRQVVELKFNILNAQELIMATLSETLAVVREQKGTIDSMAAFVAGLEERLKSVGGLTPEQQAEVDAIFAETKNNTQAIADAIDNDPSTPSAPVTSGGVETGASGEDGAAAEGSSESTEEQKP